MKLARQCIENIGEILREPLNDKAAQAKLEQLREQISKEWPRMGFSKLLTVRHELKDLEVS